MNSACVNTRIAMTSLDQNVSVIFMSNIYLKIFKRIYHKKLYATICCDSISLWILTNFLAWFFGSNVPISPSPKIPQEEKCANTPNLYHSVDRFIISKTGEANVLAAFFRHFAGIWIIPAVLFAFKENKYFNSIVNNVG